MATPNQMSCVKYFEDDPVDESQQASDDEDGGGDEPDDAAEGWCVYVVYIWLIKCITCWIDIKL